MSEPRYIVGVDLGTTNSAVAFVDRTRAEPDFQVSVFPLLQVEKVGTTLAEKTLPSFLYLAGRGELPEGALDLPWASAREFAVGRFARERGAEVPLRLVSSAKSWLSHGAVDRRSALLPFGAPEEVLKVSPIEASKRYLEHIRDAWDQAHPEHPLGAQKVFLTVPASFDAVARQLTLEAAEGAGLPEVSLLEEPQAAFYAWLDAVKDGWRQQLSAGDRVLVSDVGGGTTDFSLIEVTESGGELGLSRIAVGEHLLLGGDNMDLALAAAVARELAGQGKALDAWQQRALTQACRRAKEALLSPRGPDTLPLSIPSRGSRLLGGTLRAELSRELVERQLVEGFFPTVALDAKVVRRTGAGLREVGLPYAHDPAITRHLAELLSRHRLPTKVLFNGGVMKAPALRARVLEVLRGFAGHQVGELTSSELDLAVALGAAAYGQLRARLRAGGKGLRIRSATARAYYIGIESSMPAIPGFPPPVRALCVAPQGLEEGESVELPDDELGLVVGEPVSFRFFSSSTRKTDAAGSLIDGDDPELVELDPVEQTVPPGAGRAAGELVAVRLSAHVTELGTLELWCTSRDRDERYRLEYSVRERS